jgi:hypothetical protein
MPSPVSHGAPTPGQHLPSGVRRALDICDANLSSAQLRSAVADREMFAARGKQEQLGVALPGRSTGSHTV